MNSDSSKPSLNQQLMKANQEKIKALEESKAQLTDDLKSILDHVLMYNENSTSNPVPVASLTGLASELDVFYNTLTEACSLPDTKDPALDIGIPDFSTSSDEVLATFDFSKAGADDDHAYENLPDAPPVKLLDGDLYKRISERPELMSSILLEPANKILLMDFFKQFPQTQKPDQFTVQSELLSWAAKLPHVIADSSSRLPAAYVKTSRDLGPKDFIEVNGIPDLTKSLCRFMNGQTEREAVPSVSSGTFTAIVNCMLDIDDPLQANGESEPSPPPRTNSRQQRPVREAFQEKLLESATNSEQAAASSSSWLHRVAGFEEFSGTLVFPPNLGHTSQMARLELENQALERLSQEDVAISSGPTPKSLTTRLSGIMVAGMAPFSGFPVYDSDTGMFSNSNGTRASFTLFAATGSSHRSIFPTFDFRDIGRKVDSRAHLDILKKESTAQVAPNSAEEPSDTKVFEMKSEKSTVLSAMMQSWEELPPQESTAENLAMETPAEEVESHESPMKADEVAITATETPLDLPSVVPESLEVPLESVPAPTIAETVIAAPVSASDIPKTPSFISTQTTEKTVKPKTSKSKSDRSRSRSSSPSRKSLPSCTDLSTARSKAKLTKIKLSRSKTSQMNIKLVTMEATATSKQVASGKTETVTPVLRGKPPIKPRSKSSKKVADPGVSYREQNKEQVELIQTIQARCSTAPILSTSEKPKMDPVKPSATATRSGTANLPSGYITAQEAQLASRKDSNANDVGTASLPTSKSSTVTQFLIGAKNRLFGTGSCDMGNIEGESIEDQTCPSNMYIPSEIEFPVFPSAPRPKSPSPSASHVRILSQSPVPSRPASRTSSRTNTPDLNVLTKKPSSKLLSYAEMRKRRLELETQKAGVATNRLGFPSPTSKPKSQIPLKISPKTAKVSRIPGYSGSRPVTQGSPVDSGTSKPSRIQTPRRISKSRG